MPRRPVDAYWRERVRQLVENEPGRSPRSIAALLAREGRARQRYGWPSERTVRRLRDEHRARSEPERAHYREVRWPETMEQGALPWEASAALLELLRQRASFNTRPTVREARWFWRVTQAAPDAPVRSRATLAGWLAAWEALGAGEIPEVEVRRVEGYLSYRPWTDQGAIAYEAAVTEGRALPCPPAGMDLPIENDEQQTVETLTALLAKTGTGCRISRHGNRHETAGTYESRTGA